MELAQDLIVSITFASSTEVDRLNSSPAEKISSVTEENYSEYIIRMADYYLNRSIRSHCAAFRDGFTSIVDPAWIKLFNQRELDVIIQGKVMKMSKICHRDIFLLKKSVSEIF